MFTFLVATVFIFVVNNTKNIKLILKLQTLNTLLSMQYKMDKEALNNSQKYDLKLTLSYRIIRGTIYFLTKAVNIIYIPIFFYRIFENPKCCNPANDPILRLSATQLVSKIYNKEIKSEHVIKSYINRIREVNPLINAVIEERFDDALEEAKQIDILVSSAKFIQKGPEILKEYPLLGVPLTVKGSLAVKGLKHTSGSIARKDYHAEFDAESVALARKAGAIPLLVSNVPELCMSFETTNKLVGTTRNPHDTTRTCGGSSGGEASLLASAASVIGIGSDIAGSLRLPAHYCGVWGHKPSPGLVSFDGHFPSSQDRDRWASLFTVGPMSRYATDLRILLSAIVKPEERNSIDLSEKLDVRKIKIFYSLHDDYYWKEPNRYCSDAIKKVVNHFERISYIKPEEIDFNLKNNMPDLGTVNMLTLKDIDDMFDGNGKGAFSELMRYITLRSNHSLILIAVGLLRLSFGKNVAKKKSQIDENAHKIKQYFEELLGDNGVIILPTFPMEAPKHSDILRTVVYMGYMGIFNLLGYPVTNCPVGVTKNGLPVGVQVASRHLGDNLTLTVAEEIEKIFGGWIEPGLKK